jgi:hypothetical protein
MSNFSSVYGVIEVPRWPGWQDAMRVNESALSSLPQEDVWPFLSHSMFSITPTSQSYDCQLIHFAASMKGIEEVWSEWLTKFEALLKRMSWIVAGVTLNTEHFGEHFYRWIATAPTPGAPVTEWTIAGGPRDNDGFLRRAVNDHALPPELLRNLADSTLELLHWDRTSGMLSMLLTKDIGPENGILVFQNVSHVNVTPRMEIAGIEKVPTATLKAKWPGVGEFGDEDVGFVIDGCWGEGWFVVATALEYKSQPETAR